MTGAQCSSKHLADAHTGARVEVSTWVYEGQPFTALGAVVDHAKGIVVGYVKGDSLTTHDGSKVLGTLRAVSTWRTPRSYVSSTMTAYRATVDGRAYYGRGCGEGMSLRLHACKAKDGS